MILTYRFKLAPTKRQYAMLSQISEQQRHLYNAALQERRDAWAKKRISISKFDQCQSLTQIRREDPSYGEVPVTMSRWTISRVDEAMKGFFSRMQRSQSPGYPRFRSKSRWASFGFSEFVGIRLIKNRVLFKPLKEGIRVKFHRDIPKEGKIRSSSFSMKGRSWYCCFAVELPVKSHAFPDSVVGLDVGVEHLVTSSDGFHIKNIRPRSARERSLRQTQRALARCKRDSKRRAKVLRRLKNIYRNISNVRSNHLHQVSAKMANRYFLVAVEKLNLKNITKSSSGSLENPGSNVKQKSGLNREILDASFGRLIEFLSYKAVRAGGMVIKVDPRNTSQDCSGCGERVEKELSQREHVCGCGLVLQRDHNAAINILNRALKISRRGKPPGDANVRRRPERCLGITDFKAVSAA